MTPPAVSDELLAELVSGSHAEGTTCLAVAVAVEHDDRVLLVAVPDHDFDYAWELPTALVLPGETLLDALHRTLTVTTGLRVADLTGYSGYHDRHSSGELVRTFVFTITATDPDQICRTASLAHRWTDDDVTTQALLGEPHATAPPDRSDSASFGHLRSALRGHASGLHTAEAAVELLLAHASWLRRDDFVHEFVHNTVGPASMPLPVATALAFVDWAAALTALDTGRLPCSRSEAQLLRIAASLAEGFPVDLRDALTSLDTTNIRLIADAVMHVGGHRR